MSDGARKAGSRPEPKCVVRIGEPCSLCFPGATGPQDCGLVQLVMDDRDLRAELVRMRAESASTVRDSTAA